MTRRLLQLLPFAVLLTSSVGQAQWGDDPYLQRQEQIQRENAEANYQWQMKVKNDMFQQRLQLQQQVNQNNLNNAKAMGRAQALEKRAEAASAPTDVPKSRCGTWSWSAGLPSEYSAASGKKVQVFLELGGKRLAHPRLLAARFPETPSSGQGRIDAKSLDAEFTVVLYDWCQRTKKGIDCGKTFLATGGALKFDVTAADDAPQGQITYTIEGARFVEWDESRDAPLEGGACLDFGRLTATVRYERR